MTMFHPKVIQHKISHYLFGFCLLILASSCTTVSVQQAQNAFSAAAGQDNGMTLGQDGIDLGTLFPATASTDGIANDRTANYRLALSLIDKALSKRASLKENKLLGTALVLKGLTLLQLGEYVDAAAIANEARTVFNDDPSLATEGGRDLALAHAIGPIIQINQFYDRLQEIRALPAGSQNEAGQAYAQLVASLNGSDGTPVLTNAVEQLDAATDQVSNSKGTEIYIQHLKIAGLLNLDRMLQLQQDLGRDGGVFAQDPASFTRLEEREADLRNRFDEVQAALLELVDGNTNDPAYSMWNNKAWQ